MAASTIRLKLADTGSEQRATNPDGTIFEIPADTDDDIAVRTVIDFWRCTGAGLVEFVARPGVTLLVPVGQPAAITSENTSLRLRKSGPNRWELVLSGMPRRDFLGPDLAHGYNFVRKGQLIQRGGGGSWKQSLVEVPTVFWDPTLGKYRLLFDGYTGAAGSPSVNAIGYATSDDLETWAEYGSNPFFQRTSVGGDPDENGVGQPFVYYDDGTYYLFYVGRTATYGSGTQSICLATSTDFATWTRHGSVVTKLAATWRSAEPARPCVVKRGAVYYMFFHSGLSGGIGYATSTDLLTWSVDDVNSPLVSTTALAWDASNIGDISVYRVQDTWYGLYYAENSFHEQKMGIVFTSDEDFPLGWTKFSGNPVLAGVAATYDAGGAARGGVVQAGSRLFLFYTAASAATNGPHASSEWSIAYAVDETLTGGGSIATKNEGAAVEAATTSIDFVGAALDATTDGAGHVTVTLGTDTDATLAANSNNKIATQAAVKSYVDNLLAGLSWKKAVRAATTANITLSGAQTIDGVSVIAGDRVLVKNQSTGSQNGIYVCASGSWTRATDVDTGTELVNAACYVSEGTTLADTQWVCSTNATITVGSTSLTFAQFSSTGTPDLTGSTGIVVQTGSSTYAARTLVAGTGISLTNASGTGGNITITNVGAGGGGGSGAGAEFLISEVTPSGTGTVSFTSIVNTFRHLRVRVSGASTVAASNSSIFIRFNNDSGNNYSWQRLYGNNTSAVASISPLPTTSIEMGSLPGSTAPANEANTTDAVILDYRGTTFNKTILIHSALRIAATNVGMFTFQYAGFWFPATPAAINRVDVILTSGNFVAGTVVSLYGMN